MIKGFDEFINESKKGVKISKTSRVTGGMNPVIRFTFSDGHEIKSSSNGQGTDGEDEIYVDLIVKYFNGK
jgi:hypothetical protein